MTTNGSFEHSNPVNPELPHEETARLLAELTTGEFAQPLFGDEADLDEEPATEDETSQEPQITGSRRTLLETNNSSLVVAFYNEVGRQDTAELASKEFGVSPIGHVIARAGTNEEAAASFSATLHIGEGAVEATIEIWHDPKIRDPENPRYTLNPFTAECFEAARRVGLGDVWTRSFLAYLGGHTDRYLPLVITMDPLQIMELNETLKGGAQPGRPQAF